MSQTDRAAYNKKALDIECRVDGIIRFVQTSLSNLLAAELKIVETMKDELDGWLMGNNSMKTAGQHSYGLQIVLSGA